MPIGIKHNRNTDQLIDLCWLATLVVDALAVVDTVEAVAATAASWFHCWFDFTNTEAAAMPATAANGSR